MPPVLRGENVRKREKITTFVFILPWLLSFCIFVLYPIVFSIYVSLTDYSGLTWNMNFVGLSNYIRAFKDRVFLKALSNTFLFVLITVPATTVISLFLAVLLTSGIRFKRLFQAGYFLPSVISMVVISMVWLYIYSATGPLNMLLRSLGIDVPARSWLASEKTALGSIMVMDVWSAVGYYTVLFVAGLQSLPLQLYEAAKIDGATKWQIFKSITLPLLKPTILFVVSINSIRSFQIFTEIFTLTGGGPANSTQTIVHYLYDVSFRKFEMGYGSAIAYVLFFIVMAMTVLQRKILKGEQL
ncbi:MAG: Binding-protein-dependent transport systems inner membrane component [Thermotoga sp. 50_1627]|nr:MAG: Binding-protein-dependent transport systems inner membrane component [Thermotoga sp. 50_64]KUK24426.1 MAG: Binding-protein-dependent transport systems inner membrane component [Thermotoga sp. 50_1627]MBC7117224.1 sugar ABC transporter permease [Pseudothermotoga sp.]MDK2924057.1 multiple sugar transport system permease protein [Pseudothermotoga sp.]